MSIECLEPNEISSIQLTIIVYLLINIPIRYPYSIVAIASHIGIINLAVSSYNMRFTI